MFTSEHVKSKMTPIELELSTSLHQLKTGLCKCGSVERRPSYGREQRDSLRTMQTLRPSGLNKTSKIAGKEGWDDIVGWPRNNPKKTPRL